MDRRWKIRVRNGLALFGLFLIVSELVALYSFLASVFFAPETVTLLGWPITVTAANLVYPGYVLVGATLGSVIAVLLLRDRVSFDDIVQSALQELGAMFGLLVPTNVALVAAVQHNGVRWVGHYTETGTVNIKRQECPHCAIKLEPAHIPEVAATGQYDTDTMPEIDELSLSGSRLTSAFRYPTEADASAKNLVEARACPQCSFAIQGGEANKDGQAEVRNLIKRHCRTMEQGDEDPFSHWRHRARERMGRRPGPGDLWDEYKLECTDKAIQFVNMVDDDTDASGPIHTYPALDRLRQDARGIDRFIAAIPEPADLLLAQVVRSTYVEERKELLSLRQDVRNRLLTRITDLEKQVGQAVDYALTVEQRREMPNEQQAVQDDAKFARREIADLQSSLDDDFLTNGEKQRLSKLRTRLHDAESYLETVATYHAFRTTIDPLINDFEERFEPYADGNQYMLSRDQEYLQTQRNKISEQVGGFLRKVQPSNLPAAAEEWVLETQQRFQRLEAVIKQYNHGGDGRPGFVEEQFEQYADIFETDDGELNPKQKLAVVRNDYRNIVDASAGTGKTLTLTARYEYLYRRGVAPDNILVVTFQGEATSKLKEELLSNVDGIQNEEQLSVHTFHGFADSVVEPATEDSLPYSWSDRTSDVRKTYIEGFCEGTERIKDRHPEALNQFQDHAETYESLTGSSIPKNKLQLFLEKARSFDQNQKQIVDRLNKSDLETYHFAMAGSALLKGYRDHASETDVPVDHLDRLYSAIKIIHKFPEAFADRFEHILIDEFQDVSEPEVTLIEALLAANEDTHLFVVGDDWQSINGFKGSNPAFFRNFENRFESTTRTTLARNYRCPPAVVNASRNLIVDDVHKDKPVEADSSIPTKPQLYRIEGLYDLILPKQVVNLIIETLDNDEMDPEDILVLSRNISNNKHVKAVKKALTEKNIHFSDSPDGPGVTIQAIHSSKGKDEKCVILLHLTDDEYNGLPSKDRTGTKIKPAKANSVNQFYEEKRLAYVALTRVKEQLHIFTKSGNESPFVDDIETYCDDNVVDGPDTINGTVTQTYKSGENRYKGRIDCDEFDGELSFACLEWDIGEERFEKIVDTVNRGNRYRFESVEDVTANSFTEDIQLGENTVIEVIQSSSSESDAATD